jgi:3-deoxy-D-manno-octulosonic-acid transferase
LNLGVAPEKIHVLGNMKADLVAVKNIDVKTISEWVSDRVSFVFGSLHPSELAVLKPAITKLAARDKTAVIVAPRNPTFCKAWKKELETDGLLVELRSELPAAGSRGNILLLDTMGELAGIYSLASAAFVGGSLERSVGGHNPLEVIQQHVPLLMGPYCRNFSDIVEQLRNEGGMIQIANASEAEESIVKFIDAPAFAQQQVQAADRVLSNNTGCLQKTLEQIEFILQQAS